MVDSNGNPITWQFLVVVGALLISVAGGAIWLGSLSNQIAVNTGRLNRLEALADDTSRHDANTAARLGPLETRVDRLENWQNQVRQHQ